MAAKRRKLSSAEQSLFPKSFRGSIQMDSVTLISRAHNPFALRKILVRNNKVYWPNYPEDFTKETLRVQALLMHELCHVWQYHTDRLSALKYLISPKRWTYEYAYAPGKTFDDYPTEKQADLLQDWYRVNNGELANNYDRTASDQPSKAQINTVVPFIW